MKYTDRVYGECEITEPVVLELIDSPVFWRLKGIDQSGYRPLWVKPEMQMGEYDNSRLAHSIGVYLLLRKYGASLEEQVAGLIHDVSHSAFSHCIDYVLNVGNEHKQDHQDNVFENFVRNSEIPQVLCKYGMDPEYVLDDSNFPLKENDLPDLCADRIDYSLRNAVIFGEISLTEAQNLLSDLSAENNVWFFKNFESAKKYAEIFKLDNDIYFASFDSARMYEAVRGFVKYALDKGYISQEYLYMDDKRAIEKINEHLKEDAKLDLYFSEMNDKSKIVQVFDKSSADAEVICKSRIVNPLFMDNGRLKRVSNMDSDWKKVVKEEMKPKKYFLKFVE